MTLAEQETEVWRRLGQESVNVGFWNSTDIRAAIGDGYEEMSDESEWYERSVNIPQLSNRTYYDLLHICGTQFLGPRRAFNTTTHRWLEPLGPRDLDYHTYRQWEVNTGQPQRMMARGLLWLGMYPKPDADSGFVRFYFTAIPPAMTRDSDTPGFPQEFHQGIVEYALFDLLAQEAQTKKAIAHFQQFIAIRQALQEYVDKRVEMDRVNAVRG